MADTTGPEHSGPAHNTQGRAPGDGRDGTSPPGAEPRVIKRYANRKLYDMAESCYITHDEIAELVKGGVEVRIIDNSTKEDLTTLTLTQILFKEEKKQRRTLPLHTLRGILQTGGDFIQRHITDPVSKARDEAGETVRSTITHVFRREDELEEGATLRQPEPAARHPAPPAPEAREPRVSAHADDRGRPIEGMREWLDTTQVSFENLQRTLEDRWRLITNSLGTLDANRRRIAELESRVAELEARLAAAGGPGATARGGASSAQSPVPDLSKPDLSKPDLSKPDLSKPDLSKPDISKPTAPKPTPSKPTAAEMNA